MGHVRILFFFFIFFSNLGRSQNVKISGVARTYENKDIGVWVYRDFISNAQKQLTYTTIDSAGKFQLEFNSKIIQYITLKIGRYVTYMYIQPGMNYDVDISGPDTSTYINPNLEQDVNISIHLKSKTEINALTMDYDKRFDEFLTNEYKAFVSRSPQKVIDSFNLKMTEFYSTVNNPYFNAYRIYSIAALEEKTGVSRKKLFNSYINQKPILYEHQEYFNFFNTFYKQCLKQLAQTHAAELSKQINDSSSYDGVMKILKQDQFLENDSIRELALIKGLFESYYDGTYKKESIKKILLHITEHGAFESNTQIANNILNSFSKLQPGASAPSFELADKSGDKHSLEELCSKKYVYLFFFSKECSVCLQQMKVLSLLKKKYNSQVQFVCVSLDKRIEDMIDYCNKNPQFDWLFLYDNTGKIKNDYEIKALPSCFLIDSQGKFIQVPASRPDENLETVLFDLTKPKVKRHKVGDKANR